MGEPLKLNKFEFGNFFQDILNKGTDSEYDELFKNIDVVQSGTVDWDKFASYILNTLYESDDRMNAFSIPNWKPIKTVTK
jgi:Ca2+-binding EF-hand superfamily protein